MAGGFQDVLILCIFTNQHICLNMLHVYPYLEWLVDRMGVITTNSDEIVRGAVSASQDISRSRFHDTLTMSHPSTCMRLQSFALRSWSHAVCRQAPHKVVPPSWVCWSRMLLNKYICLFISKICLGYLLNECTCMISNPTLRGTAEVLSLQHCGVPPGGYLAQRTFAGEGPVTCVFGWAAVSKISWNGVR